MALAFIIQYVGKLAGEVCAFLLLMHFYFASSRINSVAIDSRICPQPKSSQLLNLVWQADGNKSEFNMDIRMSLDSIILQVYARSSLRERDITLRNEVFQDLAQVLSFTNATLQPFGSMCNGFGLNSSDLDVHVEGAIDLEILLKIIQTRGRNVFEVVHGSVKLPMIDLRHRKHKLRIDVVVNYQHSEDTSIFLLYSRLDARVQALGVFLKFITGKLRIKETKYGDLSSSSYIRMLIHYLQHAKPPVLPVIADDTRWPLEELKNNCTVGQLWLGFLRYYVHEFEWSKHVVGIQRQKILTRAEKGWSCHQLISIEGNVNWNEDVGSRLSPLMSDYILTVFNQLLGFYIRDFYNGLLEHNRINVSSKECRIRLDDYFLESYIITNSWITIHVMEHGNQFSQGCFVETSRNELTSVGLRDGKFYSGWELKLSTRCEQLKCFSNNM